MSLRISERSFLRVFNLLANVWCLAISENRRQTIVRIESFRQIVFVVHQSQIRFGRSEREIFS